MGGDATWHVCPYRLHLDRAEPSPVGLSTWSAVCRSMNGFLCLSSPQMYACVCDVRGLSISTIALAPPQLKKGPKGTRATRIRAAGAPEAAAERGECALLAQLQRVFAELLCTSGAAIA